jgi:thymidylate synthase
MVLTVSGNNIVTAWQAASQVVLDADKHRIRNLVVEVEDSSKFNVDWLRQYDPKSVGANDRLSVVAKVLFPSSPQKINETREEYYSRWKAMLSRSRKSRALHSSWGSTYFERLLSLDGSDNQIERMIHALTTWQRKEAALVAHLSAPAKDHLKPIGSPCLQFIEILWGANNVIDLTAVYRNHDYLNKALGNFLGLARLLLFIAKESNKKPGRIVCHSVHAYCESAPKLRKLLAQ